MATCTVHEIAFPQADETVPTRNELDKAMELLNEKGVELKFGDLISNSTFEHPERNGGLVIFDGEKIVDLSEEPDDYGCLPKEFKVLVSFPDQKGDVIPIRYWHDPAGDKRTICHNNIVWFDHTPYRETLLKNIVYDDVLFKDGQFNLDHNAEHKIATPKFAIYTHFTLGGRTYYLVFDICDEVCEFLEDGHEDVLRLPANIVNKMISVFKQRLESDKLWQYNSFPFDDFYDTELMDTKLGYVSCLFMAAGDLSDENEGEEEEEEEEENDDDDE